MKNNSIVILLLVFLVTMLISACADSSEQNHINDLTADEIYYFTGTIKEIIDEDTAIVLGSVVENNPEGLVLVDLSVNEIEVFQVEDKVKVGFDGIIMESNPAQINTLSIELVE